MKNLEQANIRNLEMALAFKFILPKFLNFIELHIVLLIPISWAACIPPWFIE